MDYKNCTRCGKEFPATTEFFRKCPNGKMGLYAWCRTCERQNRLENIEHRREIERRSYTKNRDKYKARKRERYEKRRSEQIAADIITTRRTLTGRIPTNAFQTGITPKNFKDLTGLTFGRLTVIKRAGNIGDRRTTWLCKCECGNEKIIEGDSLRSGKTKSCGCIRSETMRKKKLIHGFGNERLWDIWKHMNNRCYNTSHPNYKRYGGRGITVCDEWKNDYLAFKEWALNNGYAENLTIDRKDNDGNYEPSNCRWVILDEQNYNKRNTVFITINGETRNLKEWSEISGLSKHLIYSRFRRGWNGTDLLKPKN